MESAQNNQKIIIDKLITFFSQLSGNRSMPNLFPNIFDNNALKKYTNKFNQLAYLFGFYKDADNIDKLLNILIENITWNENLEEELNNLIKPLNLICHNGNLINVKINKELIFGEFCDVYEEIQENPDDKEQILAKYNISPVDFNKSEENMKNTMKSMESIAKALSSVLNLKKVFESLHTQKLKTVIKLIQPYKHIVEQFKSITPILELLPMVELPALTINPPTIYPLIEEDKLNEKINISGLCPLTNVSCSLHDVDIKELEDSRPYAFLIYPSKYRDLEEILKNILADYKINLKTAIIEPAIGGKYCKICKLIRYCNFCIAELGDLNLNVFMEIGLAFGFSKFTILTLNENDTAQSKVPFDLDSFMNVPYKNYNELTNKLKKHVEKVLKYLDLN